MFGIQAKLVDGLTTTIGHAVCRRRPGPAVGAAAVLEEEPAIIGKDENRLGKTRIGDVPHHLRLRLLGSSAHAVTPKDRTPLCMRPLINPSTSSRSR
jgi:hypothetical protein